MSETLKNVEIPAFCSRSEVLPWQNLTESSLKSKLTSQEEALYYMLRGDNVLLCGQAGTGKSYVINKFKDTIDTINAYLSNSKHHINLVLTASTGAAAALISGVTIHSFSGLRIDVDAPNSASEIYSNNADKKRWLPAKKHLCETDILIIDEVSMLPAYFLTNLDKIARIMRRSNKPFGGIQIILVGDFLQLPPVNKGIMTHKDGSPVDYSICTNSPSFRNANFTSCYLSDVHRSNDERFTQILNNIRNNSVDDSDLATLNSRMFNVLGEKEVNEANKNVENSQNGANTADSTAQNQKNAQNAGNNSAKNSKNTGFKEAYTLLFTRNVDVDRFNDIKLDELPGEQVEFDSILSVDKRKAAKLRQHSNIPEVLTLKVGATVMLTSNSADPDDKTHVNGSMGRVVSIYKDPADLFDSEITIQMNDGSIAYINYMNTEETHKEITGYNEETGEPIIDTIVDARVSYLPIKLAWGITVHKSQGKTLDGAILDLSQCFQRGLGYVGISRVKNLHSLMLTTPITRNMLELDEIGLLVDQAAQRAALRSKQSLQAAILKYCDENTAPIEKGTIDAKYRFKPFLEDTNGLISFFLSKSRLIKEPKSKTKRGGRTRKNN